MKESCTNSFLVFVGTLCLGGILLNVLPYSYTDSALLYLSAVLAAGFAWLGRRR